MPIPTVRQFLKRGVARALPPRVLCAAPERIPYGRIGSVGLSRDFQLRRRLQRVEVALAEHQAVVEEQVRLASLVILLLLLLLIIIIIVIIITIILMIIMLLLLLLLLLIIIMITPNITNAATTTTTTNNNNTNNNTHNHTSNNTWLISDWAHFYLGSFLIAPSYICIPSK